MMKHKDIDDFAKVLHKLVDEGRNISIDLSKTGIVELPSSAPYQIRGDTGGLLFSISVEANRTINELIAKIPDTYKP